MSIPDLISAVASPVFGILIDKFGHVSTLIPLSGLLLILSHLMFTFTTIDPVWTISVMGISYTLFGSTIWPSVPYLVGRHQIATAYGLVTVSLNISLFVFPFVVAWVRNLHSEDFTFVQYFNIGLSIVAIGLSLFMRQYDRRNGNRLANIHPEFEVVFEKDDVEESDGVEDKERLLRQARSNRSDRSRSRSQGVDVTIQVIGEGLSIQAPHTYKEKA